MSVYRIGLTRKSIVSRILSVCSRKTNDLFGFTQIATIVSLERMDPEIAQYKPHPWPWRQKKYTQWHFHMGIDETVARMDINTKIIVIEGNKASGKEQLAKDLAKQFGMLYIPETDLNELYINHRGVDYRTLNKYLTEICQAYDEKMFYENPHHKAVIYMQLYFYQQRYYQYIDALAHLFNTGQGIVLERSPWSDFVFIEAVHKCGYFPDDVRDYYYRVRHNSILQLMRPHLHIYLDVPVDKLIQRIKIRNRPWEVNSKVLTPEYLQVIEDQYKNKHLPEFKKHGEILMYDWTDGGDLEDIVEDIERIDFENYNPHGEKWEDWNLYNQELWETRRLYYSNEKQKLNFFIDQIDYYDVDNVVIPDSELTHRYKIFENMVPYYKTLPSYDPLHVGWLKSIFTMKINYREEVDFLLRDPYF